MRGIERAYAVSLTSEGYNFVSSTTGCTIDGDTAGNLTGAPALGALANDGGPTLTHLPNVGSPAIDAANPAGCTDFAGAALTKDQRGQARVVGGRCDIGAVER